MYSSVFAMSSTYKVSGNSVSLDDVYPPNIAIKHVQAQKHLMRGQMNYKLRCQSYTQGKYPKFQAYKFLSCKTVIDAKSTSHTECIGTLVCSH